MHAGDVVERLRDPHPARQHGDVGDEADVAHELVALRPGVAPEHLQLALVGGEAEDRVERGGLAGAVGADEPEDAALLDAQVDAVERDGRAEGLAQAAGFDAGHGFSAPLRCPARRAAGRGRQQLLRRQAEPLDGRVDPGPLLGEELLALALQQQVARAGIDEHAAAALALDELLVDQLLIALQDGERIDAVLGRDGAHRRQRIAFLEHAVEDHRDDAVAKLAVDRLTVVPLSIQVST